MRTLFTPLIPDDPTIARFSHVDSIDSTKPADVQAFFEQVVAQKCEGLMVKLLESGEGLTGEDEDAEEGEDGKKRKSGGGTKKPLPSTYEPDARSQGWLKVKKGECLDVTCSWLTCGQTTSREWATRSIWYQSARGGVSVARPDGTVRYCWACTIQRRVPWRQCVNAFLVSSAESRGSVAKDLQDSRTRSTRIFWSASRLKAVPTSAASPSHSHTSRREVSARTCGFNRARCVARPEWECS
jgi:hypothetical protein